MNTKIIGKYILEKLEQNGWTYEELANRVGVSSRTVSSWVKGECKSIKNDNLEAIARAFNVKVGDVMMGKDLVGLSEEDRQCLDQMIKDLNERVDDVHEITIKVEKHTNAVENRGLASAEMGFYAFGIAIMAFFLAWYAVVPKTSMLILCATMWIFGIAYMIFGKRWINEFEKKRQAENAHSENK